MICGKYFCFNVFMVAATLWVDSVRSASMECGEDGLVCHNNGVCFLANESQPARCECNDQWIFGPTFTGAQCEQPTVDCGNGIWCMDNGAQCSTRKMVWAHGNDGADCEASGGECVASELNGHNKVRVCKGGPNDGTHCNQAIGCACKPGYLGTHCQDSVVVCSKHASGVIKHYCHSENSMGCANKTACRCIDGYHGPHCEFSEFRPADGSRSSDEVIPSWAWAVIFVAILIAVLVSAFTFYMYRRERQGNPTFSALTENLITNPMMDDDQEGEFQASTSKPTAGGRDGRESAREMSHLPKIVDSSKTESMHGGTAI